MASLIESRTAVVTGAGRGIGRAVALQLAQPGVTVALVARSRHEPAETAERAKEHAGTTLVIPADLGDLSDMQELV